MSAGENIVAGQSSFKSVMNSWMNSEGHRKNILSNSFQHIGIGFVKGGNYRYNWVQMFVGGCKINSVNVDNLDKLQAYKKGKQTVKVSYQGLTTSFTIKIK